MPEQLDLMLFFHCRGLSVHHNSAWFWLNVTILCIFSQKSANICSRCRIKCNLTILIVRYLCVPDEPNVEFCGSFPVSLLPQVSLKCRAPEVSQCVFQSYEAILKNWIKSTLTWTQPLPSETGLLWPEQQPLQPVSVSAGATFCSFSFSFAPACQSALFNSVSLFLDTRFFLDMMSRVF